MNSLPACLVQLVLVPFLFSGSSSALPVQEQAPRERTNEPWNDMDYGPFLSAVVEVTPENIAPKGLAIGERQRRCLA